MELLSKIILILSCIILLTVFGEVTGETTDCSILTTVIANCSCEGPEGAPVINCRFKQLTEIPAIGNTSVYNGTIAEFTLHSNNIQHIPDNAFNGLRIKQLDITKNILNNVSDSAFVGLEESLQVLKITGDGNTSPPFTAIRNLTNMLELTMEKYKMPNSDLSDRSFLTFTKLKSLRLVNWNIRSIERNVFDGLGEVTKLVLTNLQNLTSLPHEALLTLTKLETLEISHCSLSRITDYSFSQFQKLVEINLSHNRIKKIEPLSFSGIASRLEYLDLSFNEIPDNNLTILQELTALQSLHLQNIGLLAIPRNPVFLLGKNNLQNLNLARNHITSVDDQVFVTTPNLVKLDLSENQIITFHETAFASLSQLQVLLLNHQNLQATNNVTLPSFANLTSIKSINLRSTKLDPDTSWDRLREATNLQSLNLDSTGLNVIKDFTFGDYKNLHTLDLTGNNILTITWKSFFGLRDSLTNLFLNNNKIQTLDRCTFYNFSTGLKLQLVGNPLNCDCKLRWLRGAQLNETISLSGHEQCSLPVSKSFTDMAVNDFVCNYTYTDPECENRYTTTPMSTTTTTAPTTLPRVRIKASIIGTTETTITVSWIIPQSSLVYIVGVYVDHEDLSNPANKGKSERLNPTVGQYEIGGLKAGTRYEVTVKALRVDNLTDSDSVQSPTKSKPVSTTAPPATEKQSGDETGIIVGAVIGGVIFLAILVAILYLIFIRRKPVKDTYPVQPRTFTPAELPSLGYDSKRYIRKKKDDDKKDHVTVNVISDGKTDNGVHVGRVSAGSYQCLDPETGKRLSNETNHNSKNSKLHSYVNEMQPRSTNEYTNDIDIRKLPRVPAEYRGNATKSGGYYNPSFRNSTQEGNTPHEYSEINL
ncbi:leucine-rich repeat-containing G-protein coupled receptor 5-like [Gigantopelta aegis]|uniref:leucine-rich repeat-containing G-protein coupled receptor 5-like n=1 Tax=Gigantopelta aegis TaxID=1735272 RepID=UPI001B8887AD|nr:leucine-rich repeat-containing G-protein coupled receptor 5-like [Gigantopelta aegis]